MRLSKDTVKMLRWLNQNDEWKYFEEIEKKYKKFDSRSFNALKTAKLIDELVFDDEIPDYDEYGQLYYPSHYRISERGKAYLEGRAAGFLPELREWITVGISIIALIVSIIALVRT